MSSVTEEDGMAKRASQARDAPTTDRTGALCQGTEVSTRGKRRRWTAEQKHQIVAEGMEPGVSAAMVARKHGISRGQLYAWRQQLLLRGALGGGAETMPSLAGVDVTTTAPRLEPSIPATPKSRHSRNGGCTGAAGSAGRPGRHDGARWCGRMAG